LNQNSNPSKNTNETNLRNNSLATNPNPFNQIPTYQKHYENNPSTNNSLATNGIQLARRIWELQVTNLWCMHGGGWGGGALSMG